MESFFKDLLYGYRVLAKKPGFTSLAILTLSVGLAANIATYSIVHAVLLRPLSFQHPEQLVRVFDDLRGSGTRDVAMSVLELWDLQKGSGVFQELSGLFPADADLTGGDHPERVEIIGTSSNYFTMLGAKPQMGRVYTDQGAVPGFSGELVISDALWKREFGGDPAAIGKQMRLDNDLYTIIGIMPAGFHHPGQALQIETDAWVSCGFAANPFPEPPKREFRVIPRTMGRLKPGLTVAQAQAQLDAFVTNMRRQYPTVYPAVENWNIRLVPVQEDLVGNVRTELFVLLAAVGFVLLIGCVNLATFLLARAAGRQREIAIRLALGASGARMVRQLLTESVLLSALAGGLAIGLVFLLKDWLLTLAPEHLPRLNEVSINGNVLIFAFVVSIATGILFGLAPALQAASASQISSLREGSRGSGSSSRHARLSRILVISEIALSLVLLIGAGLLIRSFQHLLEENAGFNPQNVLTARVWMPVPNDPKTDPYRAPEKRAAFIQEVIRRMSTLPGVKMVGIGSDSSLPLSGQRNRFPFQIENRPLESDEAPVAQGAGITPEVIPVLRVPLVEGRNFTNEDKDKSTPVVIVNQTLAHRYWPHESPVGHRIHIGAATIDNPPTTIVGVVGDVKPEGLDAPSFPMIYFPYYQGGSPALVLYLSTDSSPTALGDAIRREVQSVDPNIPVFSVRTMNEVMAESMAERRFALNVIGVFAIAALILAALGIYGVMAYSVTQRTHEIGIRIALGAQRGDILRMAVGDGARMIIMGMAAGLLAAIILTQFIRSMLFGVSPSDPFTFFFIPIVLAAVALLACYLPAQRATRVDPLVALREE
jgi:putative ABC transport system permease protein